MPIRRTGFVRNLQEEYGRNWKRVYYAMKSKNPDALQFQAAEGVRGHFTAKSHQRPYLRRKRRQ